MSREGQTHTQIVLRNLSKDFICVKRVKIWASTVSFYARRRKKNGMFHGSSRVIHLQLPFTRIARIPHTQNCTAAAYRKDFSYVKRENRTSKTEFPPLSHVDFPSSSPQYNRRLLCLIGTIYSRTLRRPLPMPCGTVYKPRCQPLPELQQL